MRWKLHQDGRISIFAIGCEPRCVNCFTHGKDLSQHPISWAWRLKEPSLPRLTDPRTTDAERTGSSLRFLLVLAASQQRVWTKTITRWSLVHKVVMFTPKWASALQVLIALCFFSCRWRLTFVWFRGTLKVCPWCLIFFPVYLYDGQLKLCWGRWETPAAQTGWTSWLTAGCNLFLSLTVQLPPVNPRHAPPCSPALRTWTLLLPPNQIYWIEKKQHQQ